MNNPFGLSDELFGAILASAITGGMKKPNMAEFKQGTLLEEGAKAAKKVYDSYVAVGFNEVQAFELLKLVLSK